MIARGVRSQPHLPRGLSSVPLTILVVVITLIAWAALAHSPAATDDPTLPVQRPVPADFHSIVYSDTSPTFDALYLRSMAPDAKPKLLTTFLVTGGLHARGAASPRGDNVAVLSANEVSDTPDATLTIISLPSGQRSEIPGRFDYRSKLTWSPDSTRVFLTSLRTGDDNHIDVRSADIATGLTTTVAHFSDVFEAAPVGFSADGKRLYIATVDKSGSTLWQEQGGKVQKVAPLSPGRTRDWSLSPDGARLAFVDVLGSGDPGFVGRTLILATGVVTSIPAKADELSPAWAPGSEVPVFGGPGGQLRLTTPDADAAYPVPEAYSPDGTGLVAMIYPSSDDPAAAQPAAEPGSLEIVSPDRRTPLTDAEGASFFGWVQDFN